ncbi:MAG: N-acetyltransferase [Moraxellaceae bacterium]|nr:N-acetyltransferase [Moraxellaceae bacterium]
MEIRNETAADQAAVHALHLAAFSTPAEAKLVDLLRAQAQPLVSLVAADADGIAGHILFSPMRTAGPVDGPQALLMGLAPLAVAPSRQGGGIGSALVCAGLHACSKLGVAAVAVLGDPAYYRRFGFAPAGRHGLHCRYTEPGGAPPEAFMVMELVPHALRGSDARAPITGLLRYHPAFDTLD